jgi:hypothetical protein
MGGVTDAGLRNLYQQPVIVLQQNIVEITASLEVLTNDNSISDQSSARIQDARPIRGRLSQDGARSRHAFGSNAPDFDTTPLPGIRDEGNNCVFWEIDGFYRLTRFVEDRVTGQFHPLE